MLRLTLKPYWELLIISHPVQYRYVFKGLWVKLEAETGGKCYFNEKPLELLQFTA